MQRQGTRKKPFVRQLRRIRKVCLGLPDAIEKISHGEPTFFVKKGVFAMFSNDHHHDGHVAVLLPAPPGLQEALIDEAPHAYYRPPYVGGSGWIGVELDQVTDEVLTAHIGHAWQIVTNKGKKTNQGVPPAQIGRQLTRRTTSRRVSKSSRRIHCPCHRGRLDRDRRRRRERVGRLGVDHVAARVTGSG